MGPETEATALEVTHELRHAGFVVDLGYRGNLSKRLKRANQAGAVAALIIGEDELAKGVVTLRDLDTGDQEEVIRTELVARLGPYRG